VDISAGANSFKTDCVTCHGESGHGDGPASQALDPRPANLADLSKISADDFLFWKISAGVDGTAMPTWKGILTDQQNLAGDRVYTYTKIIFIRSLWDMPISSEILAPEFDLLDDTNTSRRLSDFKGRPVILYFYPADDTPGCTKEACNFRDDYSAYQKSGVTILGVSPDSVKSHIKFKKNINCHFLCLQMKIIKCVMLTVFGDRRNLWDANMKAFFALLF